VSFVERQQRLRLLVRLEPVVSRWSARLAHDDRERVAVREYVRTLAEMQVGLVRVIRRPVTHSPRSMLVVDEFAECVREIARPSLPEVVQRAIARELADVVRAFGGAALRNPVQHDL
jgi:hypothetical protein